MASGTPMMAKNYIPYCEHQGMNYLAGAAKAGISIQSGRIAMPAGGVITFAALGMENMANGLYHLQMTNHTDTTKAGTVDPATRTSLGFTVVGPTAADVLEILVIGTVYGQAV